MLRRIASTAWLCLLALAGIVSCDVNSPERLIRAPVIRAFEPRQMSLDVLVGDTLRFAVRAVDPNDGGLQFQYLLGDSVVSNGSEWTYVVHDTGTVDVAAHVKNAGAESSICWNLRRVRPQNQPPVVVEYQPLDRNPKVTVGDGIEFSVSAVDPEGGDLHYLFTLNDSIVSASNRYTLHSSRVGSFVVEVIVSDGEAFTIHGWNLDVLAEPDSIPPAAVTLVSLVKGTEPGELVGEWIAVGDDSMEGLPSEYEVRTSASPIIDEFSWNAASRRAPTPSPSAPGTVMRMVIRSLKPANRVYVAVRAQDDFGNVSPLSNTIGEMTKGMEVQGTVRDARTGLPVPGVQVRQLTLADTTDIDGGFALTELPEAIASIAVRDENDVGIVGAYYDIENHPAQIVHGTQYEFWLLPNVPIDSSYYPSFLSFFKQMNDRGGSFLDLLRTWGAPVDVYVPAYFHNGLDYQQVVKDGFQNWEAVTGHDLFRFVDAKPSRGIYVGYDASIPRDRYDYELSEPVTFMPILGKITFRTHYTDTTSTALYVTAQHEVGHALALGHSLDAAHLMVGYVAPQVDQPTPDEILLVTAMYRMRPGTDLATYLDE